MITSVIPKFQRYFSRGTPIIELMEWSTRIIGEGDAASSDFENKGFPFRSTPVGC